MTGELLTFPIRLGLRAARVVARTGLQASERTISVASFVIKRATSRGPGDAGPAQAPTTRQRASAQEERDSVARERTNGSAETAQPEPIPEEPATAASPIPDEPAPAAAPIPDEPAPAAAPIPDEPAPAAAPPEGEPAHVSEEPTLVEEFAEPGAEDGAGAQVNVAEPWDGYAHMNAQDVIARVSDANAVELAAVQLYEAAHRNRETVMTAVKRELRAKSGRGAATADQPRKEHTNGG